ncbi:MAG: hypothetical protein KW788_01255 [Candidatus Doudnabacteria bacterium]|nr:hypothetical protein [Candidatus Doudnabacteria bacterium]
MSNKFLSEREGQVRFFTDLKISTDIELTNNTDGVYKGTLFEFKLTIPDINRVLLQAIKYLSHRRIKGDPIPAQILLVALNEENAYLFSSGDFLKDIEKIYAGAASRNNTEFNTKIQPEKIDYSKLLGLRRITEILEREDYTKVHIDVFDVVGWANRFYRENPDASKIKLFKEFREPKHFVHFIYPWKGDEPDFKYIMDLLNDKQHKKELGAFYTPPAYCLKATGLVRKAIKRIPTGHDYIILDRCAGTGNLEEFLTDKKVDDITIGELSKYIDESFQKEYISSTGIGIDIILGRASKKINEITLKEIKKYETTIKIRDYIFDNELSHTIVNTYELKEWVVLNERIGDRVKLIIPPPQEVSSRKALVEGGDALSLEFVTGQKSLGMTSEYSDSIATLLRYIKDPKTNIILYENPPYSDTSADKVRLEGLTRDVKKDSFIANEFKKFFTSKIKGMIPSKDIANLFIWSGWKYYLTKPHDAFILFSPIKYWKSHGLGEHQFIEGFLFNREHFHASKSAISCILWQNLPESKEELSLKAFDIDTKNTPQQEDDRTLFVKDILVKKVHTTFNEFYFDKRKFNDDSLDGIYCDSSGNEAERTGATSTEKVFNENILGYEYLVGYTLGAPKQALVRTTLNARKNGFYLRTDNFIDKLPLFAAKLYPQKNWFERDLFFTTADGKDRYLKDKDFLKSCFIFTCLSRRNHCRSFHGSDGRFYRNELCFDSSTIASNYLKAYKLTKEEEELLYLFKDVLKKAKRTKGYNPEYKYGTYQIDTELNTYHKNENDEIIYDNPQLNTAIIGLRTTVAKYYETAIQPKLFRYELLK